MSLHTIELLSLQLQQTERKKNGDSCLFIPAVCDVISALKVTSNHLTPRVENGETSQANNTHIFMSQNNISVILATVIRFLWNNCNYSQ